MPDVAIAFDTTGSMTPAQNIVVKHVDNLLTTAFKEIPDLRIAIGANGDYRDKIDGRYDAKNTELTTNVYELSQFIRTAEPTAGYGNGGECYELVLHNMRKLNWNTTGDAKFLVLISDEPPHTPQYHENKMGLDWKIEGQGLADLGVTIVTVQCLSRGNIPYYQVLPAISGGYALKLDQFGEVLDIIKAIIARSQGVEPLENYEKEVVAAGRMNRTLGRSFDVLAGRSTPIDRGYAQIATSGNLVPVPPGRFQMMDVGPVDKVIKNFVEENGLPFKTGRGFYQFTKREEIQEYKEIVLRDKNSGDMFSGDQAKILIGLTPGVRENLSPGSATYKYDVFIQSTSFNRKLKADTRFLYEVDLSL